MSETEKVQDQTTTNSKDAIEVSDQVLVPSGRTSTSKNALVHGLYASDIILPCESEEVFACLFRELKVELMPSGRQEMETVLSIARLNFLKHRLMRSTQMACRNDQFLAELEKAGAKTWADVSAVIQQKATAQDTLRTDMQMASQELTTALKNASDAMTATIKTARKYGKKSNSFTTFSTSFMIRFIRRSLTNSIREILRSPIKTNLVPSLKGLKHSSSKRTIQTILKNWYDWKPRLTRELTSSCNDW